MDKRIQTHVIKRNVADAMSSVLMYKDLVNATNLAVEAQVPMFLGNLARDVFCKYVSTGHGEDVDFSLVKIFEEAGHVEIK